MIRPIAMHSVVAMLPLAAVVGCSGPANPSPEASPPHAAEIIQPDYRAWERIQPGMPEAEVERLIGRSYERGNPADGTVYHVKYGRLKFEPAWLFDADYTFLVTFDSQTHLVKQTYHPFLPGMLSTDGRPTVPILLGPADRQRFDYFPRFMDFRWQPASGVYPMRYEVQLNACPPDGWDGPLVSVLKSAAPYVAYGWVGKNEGVWRVRASNAKGTSAWSAERSFGFER